MSTSPSKPAMPTATPMLPFRNGRPWVSVITTPMPGPNAASIAAWIRPAEASGSTGMRRAVCSLPSAFDRSIAALADMNPSR